jgi:predicted N-acetyltransferase YhbS
MGIVEIEKRRAKLYGPAPLSSRHVVESFECTRSELSDWLKKSASKAMENDTARTYVVCRGTRKVIGYMSLAAGSVERNAATPSLRRNTPNPIPVIILARLAVDKTEAGQGLGRALVRESMKRSVSASKIIGARALLVHALDDKVADFYKKLGFTPFSEEPNTLFIPMKTIRENL